MVLYSTIECYECFSGTCTYECPDCGRRTEGETKHTCEDCHSEMINLSVPGN